MKKQIRTQFVAGVSVALLLAGLCTCSAAVAVEDDASWIADKRGCKVANTFPREGESITWSGPCKDGYADGEGVMPVSYTHLTLPTNREV